MNQCSKILIKIGIFWTLISSIIADEGAQNKILEPCIGIVDVAHGQKIDLNKLKNLSIKFKFDWSNIVACHIFENRAVFVIDDASGSDVYVDKKNLIGRFPGEKANKIPAISHFEIVLQHYSYSIQKLTKFSGFERLQTWGVSISRTSRFDKVSESAVKSEK